MSYSSDWQNQYKKVVMACDTKTGEIYGCNPQKAIADIQSELYISMEQAQEKLLTTDYDNPLIFKTYYIWVEDLDG